METDTVYEHFSRDKFTVKKCLWARFTVKEQKLITTGNKEISFYGQGSISVAIAEMSLIET